MATKTGRLEIRAEDQFLKRLEDLASASRTSKADVIHRAIGLYAQALKEAEQGKVIKFVPENELTSERAPSISRPLPLVY
jgi:predicted transcriptional regulator